MSAVTRQDDGPATADALIDELQRLEVAATRIRDERDRMEAEMLVAKARAGELEPPQQVTTVREARAWMAWAKANGHQEGCLCHRCPKARQLL
jgi:hypothetical protein